MKPEVKPGEIVVYDYLPQDSTKIQPEPVTNSPLLKRTFRVVQWNIERAYKLPQIIQKLQQLAPDIACLQELDIGCARSGNVDSALEIAKALQMKCVFVGEFYEIESALRTAKTQGGGLHGNAILSRFPFDNYWPLMHKFNPFDWNNNGETKREPRIGQRVTLVAEIPIPWAPAKHVLCYSAHLEVYSGIYGRVMQFSEILRHAHETVDASPFQIVCGDMNTLAHSIARFNGSLCRDSLRWKSVGFSESEWWNLHILREFNSPNPFLQHFHGRHLPKEVVQYAYNPGFYDPFPVNETTLSAYWGMFKGKLDWILCRGVAVLNRDTGNGRYTASDHKLLLVDCAFDPAIEASILGYSKEMLNMRWKLRARNFAASASLGLARSIRIKNIAKHKGIMGTLVFFLVALRWLFYKCLELRYSLR